MISGVNVNVSLSKIHDELRKLNMSKSITRIHNIYLNIYVVHFKACVLHHVIHVICCCAGSLNCCQS